MTPTLQTIHADPADCRRLLLADGRPVRLIVLGTTQPPVALGVDGDGAL